MHLLFSKGLISKYLVTILTSISLKNCIEECASRPTCGLLLYDRRSKVCELHTDAAASTDNIVRFPGSVVVTGIDHNVCTTDCSADTSTIHECPHPERAGYTLFQGNMFSVGATVSVLHQSCIQFKLYGKITCLDTGVWRLDTDLHCCSDCRDCTDVKLQGHTDPGIYFVTSTFYFYCTFDADGNAWLLFQRRQDGSVDFYNDWNDYVSGFGNLNGEFWFGLESLYRIISQFPGQYELRVDMEMFNGTQYYATYSTFGLTDASEDYKLIVGGYAGNAGDSLSYHNGCAFTTYDRDNDLYSGNCAVKYYGAWWYEDCHNSNLNGRYHPDGDYIKEYANHIHWYSITTFHTSLKRTEMKIRRLP